MGHGKEVEMILGTNTWLRSWKKLNSIKDGVIKLIKTSFFGAWTVSLLKVPNLHQSTNESLIATASHNCFVLNVTTLVRYFNESSHILGPFLADKRATSGDWKASGLPVVA